MTTMQTEWLVIGIINIVISASLIAAVFLAPKYLLFGVYVPQADCDRPEVGRIRSRHYGAIAALWLAGIAVGAVIGAWGGDGFTGGSPETALGAVLVIQIGGLIPIWRSGRRQALRLKQDRNWSVEQPSKIVVDLLFRQRQRLVGNGWFLLDLAIVAACAISAWLHWDVIPDPVPTHFGLNGEADAYSSKGFGAVFTLNIVQLVLIGVLLMVNMTIRQARQQINPARPEASREQQLRFRRANSIFVHALSLFVVVFLGLGQSITLYGWPIKHLNVGYLSLVALPIVAVFGFVWYVTRQGLDESAGGSRIQSDEVWRGGGLFYYNKADPALMVEKRYGVGWTINFAHPLGIAILAGILIVPVAIILILSFLT
ncbi:DUF1648 domain-containing protein [Cohnella sp. 56]|uniref:DUF1648 domain-containing protein n=1 Tax=Cohnella sp. 56 TaxID=3113722 RepID=UPI0030E9B0E6